MKKNSLKSISGEATKQVSTSRSDHSKRLNSKITTKKLHIKNELISLSTELEENEREQDRSDEKIESKLFEGFNDGHNPYKENDNKNHDLLLLDMHADEKYHCECRLCNIQANQMISAHSIIGNNFFDGYDFNSTNANNSSESEKDFVFVLKRLFPPKNVIRTIRIMIPDTVAFFGGEPKFIAISGKDKMIRYTKQKEKLTLIEIRKYFLEKNRVKNDVHQSEEELPNQIGTPDLQNIFSEKSTITTDYEKKKTLPSYLQSQITEIPSNNKEVALAKYRDDSTQILSDTELHNLLGKRKIDPIWKDIQYLQTFSKIKKNIHNMIRIYFIYETDKNNPLFLRALSEILFLNGEIPQASEDFIPLNEEEKFEEELKNNSEEKYCLYSLFKIVHFLEQIYGTKIHKMSADFVKDEFGNSWLINISRVHHEIISANGKFIDDGNILKPNENPEKGLNDFQDKDVDIERQEAVKLLNNIMYQYYESLQKPGIQLIRAYYEDDISDEVFAKLHPGASFKLSELLRSGISIDSIKEFVINNCKQLQSARFKSDCKGIRILPPTITTTTTSTTMTTMTTTTNTITNTSKVSHPITSNNDALHSTMKIKSKTNFRNQPRPFSRTYMIMTQCNSPIHVSQIEDKKIKKLMKNLPEISNQNFLKTNRDIQFPSLVDSMDKRSGIFSIDSRNQNQSKMQSKAFMNMRFSEGTTTVTNSNTQYNSRASFQENVFSPNSTISPTRLFIKSQRKNPLSSLENKNIRRQMLNTQQASRNTTFGKSQKNPSIGRQDSFTLLGFKPMNYQPSLNEFNSGENSPKFTNEFGLTPKIPMQYILKDDEIGRKSDRNDGKNIQLVKIRIKK